MEKQINIPQLRFPDFTGEWEVKKLGEVAKKVNSGKTPLGGQSVYTEKGVLFIRSQNINNNQLELDNPTFIPEEINKGMKNSIVKPNDILLNITGASLGRSCVVPENFSLGNVNQHVCIIRLRTENNPRFLQPILSSQKGQNIFSSLQTGSGREGLNFESIKSIELSFPTLPEQQKIATFLTATDDKLQALKKKKALLEQYKKGVMQKLFSQKLRFKDENGGNFPEWEVKKLGDIITIFSGKSPSLYELFEDGKNPFIKVEELNNCNKYQKLSRNYTDSTKGLIETNSIIFPKRGAAILNNKVRINVVPLIMDSNLMALKCNENIFSEFLYYFIFHEKLYKIADTSSIPQINNKHIIPYLILLPCHEEQSKIATFLSTLDEKIDQVAEQIAQTATWKKGLLQKMFI